MTSSVFPDINVWLALVLDRHKHNQLAMRWYDALDPRTIFLFCRHTQLGLLRLLSTGAVTEDEPMTLRECWNVYDEWFDAGQAILVNEPVDLEAYFRALTFDPIVAPKFWADAYLAAFAQAANLTLVTFDRALASKAPNSLLLP